MRKIIVISMITLDGVMQAPGAPGEDPSNGFKFGGWVAPFDEELSNPMVARHMETADILLGRKTFEIFESYWPGHADYWPGINDVNKYVLSSTVTSSHWNNSVFLSSVSDIKKLKGSAGTDIKVWGSSKLVQLLLRHGLVDEIWLQIFPVVLGTGKKLFGDEATPARFTLKESTITPGGVIIANYQRSGEVRTGTIGP